MIDKWRKVSGKFRGDRNIVVFVNGEGGFDVDGVRVLV